MARRFYIVDVFAERPYAGNQLAVVVGANTMSDESMQQFAAQWSARRPATGNGAAFLGAYLLEHRFFAQPDLSLRIEQGYEIARPSLVMLRARMAGSREVWVGGHVIPIAQGELFDPEIRRELMMDGRGEEELIW